VVLVLLSDLEDRSSRPSLACHRPHAGLVDPELLIGLVVLLLLADLVILWFLVGPWHQLRLSDLAVLVILFVLAGLSALLVLWVLSVLVAQLVQYWNQTP